MAELLDLPVELIDMIATHLPRESLPNFFLTSRAVANCTFQVLHAEKEWKLWQGVALENKINGALAQRPAYNVVVRQLIIKGSESFAKTLYKNDRQAGRASKYPGGILTMPRNARGVLVKASSQNGPA